MNKVVYIMLGVLVAVIVAGFGLSQGLKFTQKTSPGVESAQEPSPSLSETMRTIEIKADEYKFSPSSVSVKQNEQIHMVFKNVGKAPHRLIIPDLDVSLPSITGGEKEAVDVKPSKAGQFVFYCSVGNHKELGMEGKVVVE